MKSVPVRRIGEMNLYVLYTENMQNTWKVEYLEEFETKIENVSRRLSEAQMCSFGKIFKVRLNEIWFKGVWPSGLLINVPK
jgi:hypothetical protein